MRCNPWKWLGLQAVAAAAVSLLAFAGTARAASVWLTQAQTQASITGTVSFVDPSHNPGLDLTIDYAVFAPGSLVSGNPGPLQPDAGMQAADLANEYVYVYQIHDNLDSVDVSSLTLNFPTPTGITNSGFSTSWTDASGIAPTVIAPSNTVGIQFLFLTPLILQGDSSSVLWMASTAGPVFTNALVTDNGTTASGLLPTPASPAVVPLPAAAPMAATGLLLLALGAAVRRRRQAVAVEA